MTSAHGLLELTGLRIPALNSSLLSPCQPVPPPSSPFCIPSGLGENVAKSLQSSPTYRSSNNLNIPQPERPHSSFGTYQDQPYNSDKDESNGDLFASGFNSLIMGITEKLESSVTLKKSERSLSVVPSNSPSPSPSPSSTRFSLPANRLFFFPSTLNIPGSRRASAASGSSRKNSLISHSSRPESPCFSKNGRSRSPSPCPRNRRGYNSAYNTPSPRRRNVKEKQRNLSVSGGDSRKNSHAEIIYRKNSVNAELEYREYDQESQYILHSLGLNPKLYQKTGKDEEEEKLPENHLGRVHYNLKYDIASETLDVRIINIKNLPKNNKEVGKICKIYIRVSLLPDERSERRAYQASNTFSDLNPIFNESFFFQVSPRDMNSRIVKITVVNIDVTRKHKVIGQVLFPLDGMDWFNISKIETVSDITKCTRNSIGSDNPEILLSLSYNPSISRLTVNVIEAKAISKNCEEGSPDDLATTFVKITLSHHTKAVKVKKTAVVKRSACPQYSESFHFRIEEKDLDVSSVTVTVMEELSLFEKNKMVGSCILGGFMFARGKGEEHWTKVKKSPKEQIDMWHPLVKKVTSSKRIKDKAPSSPRIERECLSAY